MKIQCPCGAKYEIDVTPGMQPVQFVCQSCGQDYSALVNELIRHELGESIPVATIAPPRPQSSIPVAATVPPPQPTGSRLKISVAHTVTAQPESATPTAAICAKHHEPATEQCFVCKKPICPKCMELFGYFCSPFCKAKADAQKMDAPVFEGRGDLIEKRFWKKVGTVFAIVGTAIVLFIGTWTWYAWFGSVPHTIFSVRFDDISHSGTTFVVSNQIVFLHGGTLARYDLKTGKQIWSQDLVTKEEVADVIQREDAEEAQMEAQYGKPEYANSVSGGLREKDTRIGLEEELSLHLAGQNIWIARENELTHHDWDSGKVLQQITLTNGFDNFTEQGNELVAGGESGEARVNMTTGEMETTMIPGLAQTMVAQNAPSQKNVAGKTRNSSSQGGGLPLSPYGDTSQPLDPQKIAEQSQHLTTAGRIALPAVVGENLHQQQLFREMEDGNPRPNNSTAPQPPAEDFTTVLDGDSVLQFGSKLIEERMVEHEAMKAPPKKSALDGNVSAMNESAAINDTLNDIQRNNGGSTVTEDQSIYQVTIRRLDSLGAIFTTNVVGAPQLFPLKTVNVVAAGKTIIVLDKSNKKLWQVELAYNVPESYGNFLDKKSLGQGPCVERDGTLYVYDEATLTAFDLSTGNVRWRLPSVGVSGLFFDDKGMIYLGTSTASLDAVKYSRQIDINNPAQGVLMKIDPQTGKTLWSMKPRGNICYMAGKYIYTLYEFDPGDADERLSDAGILQPAVSFITRINPKDGKVMWEHSEARAPVDVKFDGNTIRLVFKKEVEVLHYLSL